MEETAASNETGLKEEKEELRDRTGHSRTEKPAGAPGGKNGAAQGERTGARFSVLSRKKGEDRRKKDPGRAAPGRNGTRTGMGTSWRAALNI